jgi:hypothetical protein
MSNPEGFQTQVGEPRSGRGAWFLQAYRANETGPFWQGQLHDFQDVLAKTKGFILPRKPRPEVIVRIIGPNDATREQLDALIDLGAAQTWPV